MNYTKLIFSFRKRRQNLLIFRNFTILLVALVLLPAGVSAQKGNVSVNINNGTVKTFIKEIEKQTRYTFVYRNNVLNDQAKVTVNCKNKPLDQVLSQVFTPLNVSYSLNNNTIVLVKKEVQQQKKSEKKTIKGTVTDGRGEPIIGANVIQEGGIGTIKLQMLTETSPLRQTHPNRWIYPTSDTKRNLSVSVPHQQSG